MTYKVWIQIEQIDEDNPNPDEQYQDIDMPDSLGEFATLAEAERFVVDLLEIYNPDVVETSDHQPGGYNP